MSVRDGMFELMRDALQDLVMWVPVPGLAYESRLKKANDVLRQAAEQTTPPRDKLYSEVELERRVQDEKWGGPDHDDEHIDENWVDFITLRARRVLQTNPTTEAQQRRQQFIRVAALAIAAVESRDRRSQSQHLNKSAAAIQEARAQLNPAEKAPTSPRYCTTCGHTEAAHLPTIQPDHGHCLGQHRGGDAECQCFFFTHPDVGAGVNHAAREAMIRAAATRPDPWAQVAQVLNTPPPGHNPVSVAHPAHYAKMQPEPIEVIRSWGLGFNLGCVVKYCARCDHKGEALSDLKKAAYYLQYEISQRETPADRRNAAIASGTLVSPLTRPEPPTPREPVALLGICPGCGKGIDITLPMEKLGGLMFHAECVKSPPSDPKPGTYWRVPLETLKRVTSALGHALEFLGEEHSAADGKDWAPHAQNLGRDLQAAYELLINGSPT